MKSKVEIPPEHQPQTECPGCPFRGPKVGSKGDIKSPLVCVGESPGFQEKASGVPFIGDSGKLFHRFIPEDSCYVLNAMECCPPKKKDPRILNYAAHCCHERLVEKIAAYPRKLIIAMGNPAVRSLTGDYNLKITQIRGRLIPSPLCEVGILPVIHPAALMRGTGNFRQFMDDMNYVQHLLDGGEPRQYIGTEWSAVSDRNLEEALAFVSDCCEPTCDIETSGFNPHYHRILTIGISSEDGKETWCFKPNHLPWLKPLFEDPTKAWNWHNGKFDVQFLRVAGVEARVDDDSMLLSYTLDERGGRHDLEQVAGDVLDAPDYKHVLDQYLPKKGASYEHIPMPVLDEYMADDASRTARIKLEYRHQVAKDPCLEKLYTRTLIPASEMLANVEMNGIYVDQDWLGDVDTYLGGKLEAATAKVQEIAEWPVNPNSPKQMQQVLFRQFKLPNVGKGSTAAEVLEKLDNNPRTRHPILTALLQHREVAKAYGTYVKGMKRFICPDSRIYPTFLIHGTVTGRLACRQPNLQNIPRDSQIRGMFSCAPGTVLLEVDLSQAELRLLASLSNDPVMVELYNDGRSIHKELAYYLFGEDWKKAYSDQSHPRFNEAYEQYTRCKNVNFGIIYGITKYGLADQINSTLAVAQEMIDGWAERFPTAWAFIQKCRETPRRGQVITTAFGRKKRVYLVTNSNVHFLQNEAANFPPQSIASDITLHSAIECEPELRRMGIKVVNLVHDSIVMEVPDREDLKQEAAYMVAKAMETVPLDWINPRVPFVAEAAYGLRWGKENMGKDFEPVREAA